MSVAAFVGGFDPEKTDWEELDDGPSNYDFSVPDGVEDRLRAGNCWVRYAGWNFNGRVWFAGGLFYCQVWTYCAPRETIAADTVLELMHEVSREYGYD